MHKSGTIICLMLLSPAFSVSHAQDTEVVANIRCLIVGAQLSKSADANRRSVGMMEVMYYLGRVDRFLQMPNLEALIERESTKMTTTELTSEAVRCGKILAEKGNCCSESATAWFFETRHRATRNLNPLNNVWVPAESNYIR